MATDTITAILPHIYEALDVVSREPVGMIGSVTLSASAQRASLNQSVDVPIEGAIVGVTSTPAMTVPEPGAQTPTVATITISNSKAYPFQISGDVEKGYNTAHGWLNGKTGRIAQAIRACTNDVEATLCGLHSQMSRAYGTASAVPFASTLADTAQLGRFLTDNGAPAYDRKLVINTNAGANLRTLGQLTKANEAGTSDTLRMGRLLNINNFDIAESGQVVTKTAGAMASATVNNAGYAVGATVLTLSTAGTGVVSAGDVVTFAGDTNQYVIASVVFAGANPAAGDTITIAEPGLRVAMSAATKAITVIASTARNMAFSQSAIILAARPVATPEGGDIAVESMMITDPVSGLPLEICHYLGYKMNRWEINLAWGAKVIKPAHTMLLLSSV